jgi:hypothetical protein
MFSYGYKVLNQETQDHRRTEFGMEINTKITKKFCVKHVSYVNKQLTCQHEKYLRLYMANLT